VNIEELYSLIDVLACVFFCFFFLDLIAWIVISRMLVFPCDVVCLCFLFCSILYAFYSSFGFLLYLLALICD
jgi:hypothetical protein